MKNEHEAIVFDFGGVIINIDYDKSVEAFANIGVDGFDDWYSQKSQSDLFDRLEVGAISPSDFRRELRMGLGVDISDSEIDACWNALLLDYPMHRLEFLQNLNKEREIYLLSNTNKIHEDCFLKSLRAVDGAGSLDSYFKKVFMSHKINRRKPELSTFRWVAKQLEVDPGKILFVDDSIQHVEGARKAGWDAHLLPAGQDVVEWYASL